MNASGQMDVDDAPLKSPPDFDALIASLRLAGAEKFDPVGLHFIDALARRASSHEGSVRHLLDSRLERALAAFKERFDCARSATREAIAESVKDYPQASNDLQRLFAAGDFQGVRQHTANLRDSDPCASLGALVRRLEQQSHDDSIEPSDAKGSAASGAAGGTMSGITRAVIAGQHPELKTIRNFRNTWSKLSVEKQVTQALEQAPANAGPINSHMLVLRSLALMRDISPDYLNRFMTYADTLLCLDQGEKEKVIIPKKRLASKAPKK
jgi:AcrR family transcriptional regulator